MNGCRAITSPERQLARMSKRHVRKAQRMIDAGRFPNSNGHAVGRAFDMLTWNWTDTDWAKMTRGAR